MINFDYLEANKEKLREEYLNAKPFPNIAIDNFYDEEKLTALVNNVPDMETKSADYAFSKNKFEKSKIKEIAPEFEEFHTAMTSDRFKALLQFITGEDIFVDPELYGGGIHQGKEGSFLDMHVDFNYHPLKPTWYRNLNILLYLNKDWKEEYGGHLKLEHSETGEKSEIGVPFNRLAIMQCRGYTLHGYDKINFPPGRARLSMATYAFSIHEKQLESARTTKWKIEKDKPLKYILSKLWIPAVKIKSMFFKSKTGDH